MITDYQSTPRSTSTDPHKTGNFEYFWSPKLVSDTFYRSQSVKILEMFVKAYTQFGFEPDRLPTFKRISEVVN